MPFRFPCEHCGQTLKVSTKKIGKSEACPACKRVLIVPSLAEAAARFKSRKQAAVGAEGESESSGGLSEFVVYDDDTELVYETDDPPMLERAPVAAAATVDLTKVSVPRTMLYLQGGLLALVALAAFGLGIVVGSGMTSTPVVVDKERSFALTGKLQYRGARGESPDEGAVVVVVPVDARPEREKKLPTAEFLPGPSAPPADSPGLKILREIGGDYTRADATGNFRVQLPRLGNYYVLFISRASPPVKEVDRQKQFEDLAQMGIYFDRDVPQIGERHNYRWSTEKFNTDATRTFTFGN